MLTLKGKFIKGIRWNALSTIGVAVLELLRLYILIRLLEAEEFGLFALSTIVLFYIDAFKDLGFSGAIIHKKVNKQNELSSIFWLTILVNLGLAILTFLIAPLISSFFNTPELTKLIQLVSVIMFIGGIGTVFQSVLIKELEFKKLALINLLSSIVYFTSSIYLAYSGFGVYALVYGLIIKSLFENFIYVLYGLSLFKPDLKITMNGLGYYLKFGSYQLGDRGINVIRKELDTLLIGKFLGTETLGIYAVMKNLIIRPYTLINPLVTNVTQSYMSKLNKNIKILKETYLKQLNVLTTINVFVYFFLAFFAVEIVQLYYGDLWQEHSLVFAILSIAIFLMSIANPVGTLIVSTGRADKGFYWNIGVLLLYVLALYFGVQSDLFYLTIAILIVQVVLFFPNFIYLVKDLAKVNLSEYLGAIYKPIVLMMLSAIVSFFVVKPIENNLLSVLLGITICGILYTSLIYKYQKESFNQLQILIGLKS